MAARPDGAPSTDRLECGRRLAEVVPFEIEFRGDAVLPHVVGDLESTARRLAERRRIELGDPAGREDRESDPMAMEQLEQSPDPGAATEFALRQLQRGLSEHPPEELRVEVEREVDGEPHPVRVPPAVDVPVASHPARLSDVEQRSIERLVRAAGNAIRAAAEGLVVVRVLATPERPVGPAAM